MSLLIKILIFIKIQVDFGVRRYSFEILIFFRNLSHVIPGYPFTFSLVSVITQITFVS